MVNLFAAADVMILETAKQWVAAGCFQCEQTEIRKGREVKVLRTVKPEIFADLIEQDEDCDIDTCLCDDHPAGSEGRIAQLREFYANPSNEGKSSCVLTDDEEAARLLDTLVNNCELRQTPLTLALIAALAECKEAENELVA